MKESLALTTVCLSLIACGGDSNDEQPITKDAIASFNSKLEIFKGPFHEPQITPISVTPGDILSLNSKLLGESTREYISPEESYIYPAIGENQVVTIKLSEVSSNTHLEMSIFMDEDNDGVNNEGNSYYHISSGKSKTFLLSQAESLELRIVTRYDKNTELFEVILAEGNRTTAGLSDYEYVVDNSGSGNSRCNTDKTETEDFASPTTIEILNFDLSTSKNGYTTDTISINNNVIKQAYNNKQANFVSSTVATFDFDFESGRYTESKKRSSSYTDPFGSTEHCDLIYSASGRILF